MNEPRIHPLEPPYRPEVAAALKRVMPEGVPPLALFRTLAVNERVFLRLMAGGLLDRSSLSSPQSTSNTSSRAIVLGSPMTWTETMRPCSTLKVQTARGRPPCAHAAPGVPSMSAGCAA